MDAARRLLGWGRRRAEDMLTVLLLAMFVAFMLQIVTRYVLNAPLSWTAEFSTFAWLWGVLWGAGLVLRDDEELRFDLIYGAMPRSARRVCDAITAFAVVAVFTWSLPAMVDYVTFMKVERSAYLGIRFDIVYSVWLVFAVAMIVRHAAIAWRAITGRGIARVEA